MNITKRVSTKIAMIGLAALLSTVPLACSSAFATAAAASSAKAQSNIKLTINGQEYSPSSAPLMHKGTVYLPLRDVSELLGSVVFWNAKVNNVTMTYPNRVISMKLNTSTAIMNGKTVKLDSPPFVKNGVPSSRFASSRKRSEPAWIGLLHQRPYLLLSNLSMPKEAA